MGAGSVRRRVFDLFDVGTDDTRFRVKGDACSRRLMSNSRGPSGPKCFESKDTNMDIKRKTKIEKCAGKSMPLLDRTLAGKDVVTYAGIVAATATK